MGVLVLPPRNFRHDGVHLQGRRLISPPRPKPRRSPPTNSPVPVNTRSGRRKQWSPTGSPPPPQSKPDRAKSPVQIRILKRGEALVAPSKPDLSSSDSDIATPVEDRKTKRCSSVDRPQSCPLPSTAPIRRGGSVDRADSGPAFSPVPIRRGGSVDRAESGPALSRRFVSFDLPDSDVPIQTIQKPIKGFYAGSAFSTSPPPSSLPVPAFCSKIGTLASSVEDVALDLRKILRLEF